MKSILKKFKINEEVLSIEPYGNGHINATYLVKCENNKQYILQKINNHVFPRVLELTNNRSLVTSFLKAKNIQTLEIIPTIDNQNCYYDKDNDSYYRVDKFVENSLTIEKVTDSEIFKKTGKAFGKFANDLKDFDASKIKDVIDNFHNTKVRYEHFLKTLNEDKCNRAFNCKEEIDFVLSHKDYCFKVVDLIEKGLIPLKVTHNDTKLNNILFNKDTLEPMCIIDLDTIMQGSILYDFGDSIRYGCNLLAEDDINFTDSIFSLEYFKAYAEGYLSETKESLNKYELDNLAFSGLLMTLECGIRFLDDYLDGDHYFKIHYENQNLNRCKNQFRLVKEMEENMSKMESIIRNI